VPKASDAATTITALYADRLAPNFLIACLHQFNAPSQDETGD
jgi:hypothetical protein